MKGKIELFYALPQMDAYLEEKGVPEQLLKPLIHMLIAGAAEHYLEEKLSDVEGVIGDFLQNEGLETITQGAFEDLAAKHCKVLVERDEHILNRKMEILAKRKKNESGLS